MSKKKNAPKNKLGNTIGYVDINADGISNNLSQAKQDFQKFIEQTGSMMQNWGNKIEGFGQNLALWTPPVKADIPKKPKRYKKGKWNKR